MYRAIVQMSELLNGCFFVQCLHVEERGSVLYRYLVTFDRLLLVVNNNYGLNVKNSRHVLCYVRGSQILPKSTLLFVLLEPWLFALHLKLTFFIFSLFLDRQHFLLFDLFDAINVFTRKKLDVSLGR